METVAMVLYQCAAVFMAGFRQLRLRRTFWYVKQPVLLHYKVNFENDSAAAAL